MQRVVLRSGIEVVYNDDQTVSLERDGLRLRSLVITLAHLLALIGAHLEVVARRKSRTVKQGSLTATNHPIGQFIELIVRMWRTKFGEQLVLSQPVSFRPGMDLKFGRRLRVTAAGAPTEVFTLSELLCIEQLGGNEFRVSDTDWNELMMAAALELLGPMWQQVGKPREVSEAALRNPGWEMMAQALVHNRWVMWLAWLILIPFLRLREVWQRFRLAADTTFYSTQLQSGLSGTAERVKELQALAEAARTAQAEAEGAMDTARIELARDQQLLQEQQRKVESEAAAVRQEVGRITATHEQVVAELRQKLVEKSDTITRLELERKAEATLNAQLQQLVENYEASLRQLPPES